LVVVCCLSYLINNQIMDEELDELLVKSELLTKCTYNMKQ